MRGRIARSTSLALAVAGCGASSTTQSPWPTREMTTTIAMFRRVEVHDAEALADGNVMLAGSLGDTGFVARVDGDGLAAREHVGRFVTDLALASDDGVFAVGWDEGVATVWQLDRDGKPRERTSLPVSDVGVDPYRVLPGPIVIGTQNPITSGALHGWIVRRKDGAWHEELRHGGGYSGFLAAASTGDGFVAAGMGSRTASYQGWVGLERAGTWHERHLEGEYRILHAVAPLPDGGFVVAGVGRAALLDASLAVVDEVSWPHPGVFTYAPMIVDGDVAWLLSRHGRLRNEYTRVEISRLGLRSPMAAPTVFRAYEGATQPWRGT